jgi:AcrR family transcriptional regulator
LDHVTPLPSQPTARPVTTPLNREQIMRATAVCLRQWGYDGTTIRRISADLGCAVGSIYRYFSDKRLLLYTVTQQVLEPVAVMAEAGGRFEHTVRLYHERASNHPEAYRLMFWLASSGKRAPSHPRHEVSPTHDRAGSAKGPPSHTHPVYPQGKMPGVIKRIIDAWSTRLVDPDRARRRWSVLHGAIILGQDLDSALADLRAVDVATPPGPAEVDEPPTLTPNSTGPLLGIQGSLSRR